MGTNWKTYAAAATVFLAALHGFSEHSINLDEFFRQIGIALMTVGLGHKAERIAKALTSGASTPPPAPPVQ